MISSLTVDVGILFSEHKVDHKAPETQVFYSTQDENAPDVSTVMHRVLPDPKPQIGPRGTGETSTARIFASALNCLATEETKPCGVFRECADFISGKVRDLREVDSSSKKGIDRIWMAFLKFLEQPPPRVVFIFMTTDLDNVLHTVLSRCQTYLFNKSNIVTLWPG
ncbi:AAA-type ATPase family protein [Actinidia rufa]|uniref:AAA-type ATPase family protein n=1 Tax=Actinidia rufa TaxID=165716 RepID=A0A7J0F123_9ERIC|nr:AAA-type ATPase family protein [Actinidia rufa]